MKDYNLIKALVGKSGKLKKNKKKKKSNSEKAMDRRSIADKINFGGKFRK